MAAAHRRGHRSRSAKKRKRKKRKKPLISFLSCEALNGTPKGFRGFSNRRWFLTTALNRCLGQSMAMGNHTLPFR
ncbi:hypothetical protein V6Z11_D07G118100 [Gossypium hirsutum]